MFDLDFILIEGHISCINQPILLFEFCRNFSFECTCIGHRCQDFCRTLRHQNRLIVSTLQLKNLHCYTCIGLCNSSAHRVQSTEKTKKYRSGGPSSRQPCSRLVYQNLPYTNKTSTNENDSHHGTSEKCFNFIFCFSQ